MVAGMKSSARKCLVDVPGLPKPWMAYFHLDKKRIFYHNKRTGESLWEPPAEFQPVCGSSIGDLNEKFKQMYSVELGDLYDADIMDCSEYDQATGNVRPHSVTLTSTKTSTLVDSEEMDVEFMEDFRHIRRICYDQNVIDVDSKSEQSFPKNEATLRECVVFDTCSLIADLTLVRDCVGKGVSVVIPYRVLYELDKLKKIPPKSSSARRLSQKASRVIKMLRDLRGSPLVYWESSTESYEEVEGFVTNSSENVNDDYVLKCAYRMKSILDSRGENWETVFLTDDQLLSLKAHASGIQCISVKEAKAVLKNIDSSPCTSSSQTNVATPARNTKSVIIMTVQHNVVPRV
ncbi:hypothetical protein KIN20_030713 [Parelaphostrongylus tenuis]|uniref:WW domain-containing protein n=1 Tax=Parelaphostrongylus tenuis TaxID=148309 RepID=A0AAD5R4E9_PARTN|nr:hypothetical protein KIN20_030713 [Parelaphostrongylus tenuis]